MVLTLVPAQAGLSDSFTAINSEMLSVFGFGLPALVFSFLGALSSIFISRKCIWPLVHLLGSCWPPPGFLAPLDDSPGRLLRSCRIVWLVFGARKADGLS